MGRRIVSIICIMFLLFTITSPISGSIFTYADEGLDDQQKAALAMSSYFNYRKGWYVGSTAGAIAVMKSYIDEYFASPANSTDIKGYSDFVSHISVSKDNDNHWGVTIDNTGLVFLDHLVKWLLGKNKFPNLYSGGSWGSGPTSDEIYNNFFFEGKLVTYIDDTYSSSTSKSYNESLVNEGTYIYLDGQSIFNLLKDKYGSQLKTLNNTGQQISNVYPETGYLSFQFSQNFSEDYNFLMTNTTTNNTNTNQVSPKLTTGNVAASGSTSLQYACRFVLYCDNGIKQIRGAFENVMFKGNNTRIYSGMLTHNFTDGWYVFVSRHYADIDNNTPTINIGFNTNNFDNNDVGQADSEGQPVTDAPSKTFTPEYTTNEGDTYNYYTNETVNNFYNEYTNNYTYNTNNEYNNTVINNNTSPDDPDQPAGGTTPPWDNSSGSGTITPDGNGGYNFNLPDLTLPDLNIDWSINGLKDKFPFSIPWDLMAFFTVLNAEPETPEFTGEVDLGISIWNIEIDLHDFDLVAALVRNLEFIAFCIGLIIVTRSIIKG